MFPMASDMVRAVRPDPGFYSFCLCSFWGDAVPGFMRWDVSIVWNALESGIQMFSI